jgi:hypothetical protein
VHNLRTSILRENFVAFPRVLHVIPSLYIAYLGSGPRSRQVELIHSGPLARIATKPPAAEAGGGGGGGGGGVGEWDPPGTPGAAGTIVQLSSSKLSRLSDLITRGLY